MLIKVKKSARPSVPQRGLVNQQLGALPQLIALERQGKITPAIADRLIGEARAYAVANKLPFDGTMRGVFKLAEEADRELREYIDAYNKWQDGQRRNSGKRRVVNAG
jgi:hypothetical protein